MTPIRPDAHLALGRCYSLLANVQNLRSMHVGSDDPDFGSKARKVEEEERKYIRKALEEFTVATRLDPKYFDAYLEIADCHATLASRARYKSPTLDEAEAAKSLAQYRAEIHNAIEAMTAAVKLRLDSKEAWTKLGGLWAGAEQYDNARRCLRTAIQIDSEESNDQGSLSLSNPYLDLESLFEKTEWVNGELMYNRERLLAGIEEFRSLGMQYPKRDTIHLCLGELYLKLGDRKSALDEYKVLKSMSSAWTNLLLRDIYK